MTNQQMGLDLNINWENIAKQAGGELAAQALQSSDVQNLIKQSGGDVMVKTAGDKLAEYKATLNTWLEKAKQYKFWLMGAAVVIAGMYFMKKSRRPATASNPCDGKRRKGRKARRRK